jgi:hypothetical protein
MKTQLENSNENSVEKCRLFHKNTQKADISLRSNILQSQMQISNGNLKWKSQMKTQLENSVEKCRPFQIVRRTIRLTGCNATKSQQNPRN